MMIDVIRACEVTAFSERIEGMAVSGELDGWDPDAGVSKLCARRETKKKVRCSVRYA